ncbi:MAG: inositol-3-phosphate synthase, partial [Planctomycetota bacterium]
MTRVREKVGLWMIGAGGRVGSAVALGVTALAKRLAQPTGLVSALPVFDSLPLIDPGTIVIGGHEVRSETILDAIHAAHEKAKLFDEKVIRRCAPRLRAMQRNLRPGSLYGAGPTIRKLADLSGLKKERSGAAAIERLSADIDAFRRRHSLDCVVVIHVASSEPPFRRKAAHARFDTLQRALSKRGSNVLPTSSLYALAAIEAGCPFINFTPSLGIDVPAIRERADHLGLPYMGRDGKTGETLVKSILAPMFAMRNLSVLSWVGQNILGNRDGAVLRDPKTRQSKIQTKDKIVSRIVGGSPTTRVSIDYVPSLDDWKVAWDFI